MLEQFIAMVVEARKAGVSMGVMRAQLLLQGMDEEETTLLIDIVALEVRHAPSEVHVNPNPITMKYKVTETPQGQVIDCYV